MKLGKSFLRPFLLLSYIFLLTACSNNDDPIFNAIYSYRRVQINGVQLSYRSLGSENDEGKIKYLIIEYGSDQKLSLDKARQLYIKTMEFLVEKLNSDPSIEREKNSFLTFPLSYKNIKLQISCDTKQRDTVVFIHIKNNMIYYCYYDESKAQYVRFHSETFEEAAQKLQEEKLKESSSR